MENAESSSKDTVNRPGLPLEQCTKAVMEDKLPDTNKPVPIQESVPWRWTPVVNERVLISKPRVTRLTPII